jgi:predicted nucleic acid-binding protein
VVGVRREARGVEHPIARARAKRGKTLANAIEVWHVTLIDRIRNEFLGAFIAREKGQIVAVTPEDMEHAAAFMRTRGLDSYDAAHAGVMKSYDVADIATNDSAVEAPDRCNLWLADSLHVKLQDNPRADNSGQKAPFVPCPQPHLAQR